MEFAYGGVLCSAFTQLAIHPFVRQFASLIMPLSRACGHLITCLIQLLLQNSLQLIRGYLASLLTILGTLHKPSRGVSEITTERLRRFPEVNSIIRHTFGIGQPSVHTAVT